MGAVYMAQDTQLGDRPVAVKEMSTSRLTPQEVPSAVEQFRHEAYLLASLHHSYLPAIYEHFFENDRWYLVMSFIEGQTLQAALDAASGHRFSVKEVVRIGIELCDVLEYLHAHTPQVIFRDLKPLNIMLTPKGHICLIDFGIARHFKKDQAKDTAYYYSAGYAPPEQYGRSQTGPRSDIYSLGATLHQMLSGQNPASKPFQFPNLQSVDSTIPEPLARLIAQMLEMNEQARPASVAEIKTQLEKILTPSPLSEVMTVQLGQAMSKGNEAVAPGMPVQPGQTTSRGSEFSARRWIVAWLCFIVLTLAISWSTVVFLFPQDVLMLYPTSNYNCLWLAAAGTGAAFTGLIFLLTKGQPLIEMIGSCVLAAFGNLALLTFLSPAVADCLTPDSTDNCLPFHTSILPYSVPILCISILLLSLGTLLFLSKANVAKGLIFGSTLIVAGIAIQIIIQKVSIVTTSFAMLSENNDPLPTIVNILWLPPTILGIGALVISLGKLLLNKFRIQAR